MYYEIMILRNYYKLEETNFNEFKLILKCIIEIKIFVKILRKLGIYFIL